MKISFSGAKQNAGVENHVKLSYANAKRVFPHFRWMVVLAIVFSPFLYLAGKLVWESVFVTSPGMVWMEKQVINDREAGTVKAVYVHRGDSVEAGTLLFEIERKLPENRLEQIALLEAERGAVLRSPPAAPAGPAGGAGDGAVSVLRQNVAYYRDLRDKNALLVRQKAATQAELNLAEAKLREAEYELANLLRSRALQSGGAALQNRETASRLAQLETSIESLRRLSGTLVEIRANDAGKVDAVQVSAGQSFSAGEPLAVLTKTGAAHILTYVEPDDYAKIHVGSAATVKILGTGRKIQAVVEESPVEANVVPSGISDKMYPVMMRGVQVFLKANEPLRPEEMVAGLPVVVEW